MKQAFNMIFFFDKVTPFNILETWFPRNKVANQSTNKHISANNLQNKQKTINNKKTRRKHLMVTFHTIGNKHEKHE